MTSRRPSKPVAATDTGPLPPSREDPVVAGASRVFGGPWGQHAIGRTSRWWSPLGVLFALTLLTLVAGFLLKAPCRTHPWTDEYQFTRMCYSDIHALYFAEGLASGKVPYRDHPVEYPVVMGGLMSLAATIVRTVDPDAGARLFFDLTALLLAGAALIVTWTTARLAGRQRPWDAAMVALAPALLLHAFTNWDLAAVALAGLGCYAWSRGAPGWAGVWLGLGAATKLYPLLLLVGLLPLCLRAGRLRAWGRAAAAALVAWLVVNLPVWIAYPDAFGRFFQLNRSRGADWDSLWFLLQHLRGRPLDLAVAPGGTPDRLNALVAIGELAVVAGVVLLVLRASRRPRVAQVAFLLVAGFLLVNKVHSPQFVLWLTPLAVLARPRWGAFLTWQAAEAALLVTRFLFFVNHDRPGQGLPLSAFLGSVVVRDLVLLGLIALVVREVLDPRRDPVRRGEVDDPAGGLLDGSADRPRRLVPAATAS